MVIYPYSYNTIFHTLDSRLRENKNNWTSRIPLWSLYCYSNIDAPIRGIQDLPQSCRSNDNASDTLMPRQPIYHILSRTSRVSLAAPWCNPGVILLCSSNRGNRSNSSRANCPQCHHPQILGRRMSSNELVSRSCNSRRNMSRQHTSFDCYEDAVYIARNYQFRYYLSFYCCILFMFSFSKIKKMINFLANEKREYPLQIFIN